ECRWNKGHENRACPSFTTRFDHCGKRRKHERNGRAVRKGIFSICLEVQTVDDALHMILDLGKLVDRVDSARLLYERIVEDFATFLSHYTRKRVAYVIWKDPYMVVGKNTYIQSLLERLGFVNPFLYYEGRYPEVTIEDLRAEALDYFLLASEPYPFREKHQEEFLKIDTNAMPLLVDGEMFWYGVKMLRAVEYFKMELAKNYP